MTTFILAVDHRDSLRRWLGSLGVPAAELERSARLLKTLCVEALAGARERLEGAEAPMLLLDEEYGVDAIPAARERGLPIVIPVERSGQAEFRFEHGENFGAAIERAAPDAVKALVRYNPAGDGALNSRAAARLLSVQQHLRSTGRRFMLELLVPPTPQQRAALGSDFDGQLRPELTVDAIDQLAAAGLRPDWWKLEGNNDRAAATAVAAAGSRAAELGCLVLGRGEDAASVVRWVKVAAAVDGFAGFAVGRTLWTEPFAALLGREIDTRETVGCIADAYLKIASAYRMARQVVAGSGERSIIQQSKQWEEAR